MSKRYAPVHISNPLSEMHMVYLHPNQSFVLSCSGWVGVTDVEYNSDFFGLINHFTDEEDSEFWSFEQLTDLSSWTPLSNTYLGEVTIIMKDSYCSLCVILLSSNPSVLTLINPGKCEIKVQPHQILEVIFYGDNIDNLLNNRSVSSGHMGILFREKGYEEISSGEASQPVAPVLEENRVGSLALQVRNTEHLEHHFWFGVDSVTQTWVNSLKNGVYHGGKISFGKEQNAFIVVNINVKKREIKQNPLPQPKSYIVVPTYRSNNNAIAYRPGEPRVTEVNLEYLETPSLHSGCKTLNWHEVKEYAKTHFETQLMPYAYVNPYTRIN